MQIANIKLSILLSTNVATYCCNLKSVLFCSCIHLKLDSLILQYSKKFGIHVNVVAYKYTSEETFTTYLKLLEYGGRAVHNYESNIDLCEIYLALLVYNYAFVPCNLTSGTPRPLCSHSCYFARSNCSNSFNFVLKSANIFKEGSFVDDCENTLHFINEVHNFPNSSKYFEDDCIDFPGRLLQLYTII